MFVICSLIFLQYKKNPKQISLNKSAIWNLEVFGVVVDISFPLASLTSAGVNVSARRGETSGAAGVDSRHPELVPTARPDVREPRSLLSCLRGIRPTTRGRYEMNTQTLARNKQTLQINPTVWTEAVRKHSLCNTRAYLPAWLNLKM